MPFKSTVGDYQTVATLETFGFLPPMTQDEIYDQIAYSLPRVGARSSSTSTPAIPWPPTGLIGSFPSLAKRTST